MKPSKYQLDIFEKIRNTKSNICISATAGSGKSTTIVKSSELLPRTERSIFVAFNAEIVKSLKLKLPYNIDCLTIHSLGMRSIIGSVGVKMLVSKYKVLGFCEKLKEKNSFDNKEWLGFKFNVFEIVNKLRLNMLEPTIENINFVIDYYDISTIGDEAIDSIEIFNDITIYNKNLSKKTNVIDFIDMIYLPAMYDYFTLPTYDNVFVDEGQDLSKLQHLFINKLVNKKGRIVFVGDKYQAIYGFAGADVSSFESFEKRENTLNLPLSICYRCAKEIVKKAKEVNDEIEPFDEQKEGVVRQGSFQEIDQGDMVLSRITRPLIYLFYKLLENNKKSYIVGKDIETGLKNLVIKLKGVSVEKGMERLRGDLMKIFNDLKANGYEAPERHPKYVNLSEKIMAIQIISKGCDDMKEVEQKISQIFEEKKDAIKLMTIHKSKGLENERVFLITKFDGMILQPWKYAKKSWELVQERNLMFVAYTRAKSELILFEI